MREVVPGSYDLTAFWNEGPRQYVARQTITVGGSDVDDVTLVIAPGITLAGRVHREGDALDLTSLHVDLRSRDHLMAIGDSVARVEASGRFSFTNVQEGVFDAHVLGLPEGIYMASARFGAQETLDAGLRIAREQPVGALELTLGRSSAQIEGRVRDDERRPAADAQIVVIPNGDRRGRSDFYRTTTSDSMGRFSLSNVPAGGYQIFAWRDIEPRAYLDPEFLQPFDGHGAQVTIQDSGHYSLELSLISALRVP